MREHDYDVGHESIRPRADRVEEPIDSRFARAAAGSRLDALDPHAVLRLQRAVGNVGVTSALSEDEPSPVHDVVNSGGRPLDADVRSDMESRLGADFGDVRVHDDSAAHDSATSVGAHAYTVGSNVVFQRDVYDPSSTQGRTTLAHELTHVVQQRHGPVDGTEAPGGIKVSHPSDRFEREASETANRVMAGPSAVAASDVSSIQRDAIGSETASIQRDETEEEPEESVQGLFVQREDAPEEETEE